MVGFGTVVFIVETSFFMTPRVVVSCFGVVGELSAGIKGVLGVALLVVPLGGVPPVDLFVIDTMSGVVADAFVVDVSVSALLFSPRHRLLDKRKKRPVT